MKIFTWNQLNELSDFVSQFCTSNNKKSALTIGGFDGPHLGHKKLFDEVLKQNNCAKGIVTFRFTKEFVKFKKNFSGSLTTFRLKMESFEKLGFDFCLVIDFSVEFSRIKGIDFLKMLRESCSMQFLAVGSDFHCGYNLDTGVAELSDYAKQTGLELSICEQVLTENYRISSSFLRNLVYEGNFSKVNELLVFPFALDAMQFDWQDDSSETCGIKIANNTAFQALPQNGSYSVKVFCINKDVESFVSCLYVESNFLRLEVPLEQRFESLEKIEFI